MDISIVELVITPDTFGEGGGSFTTISYKGIVSGDSQNPVQMKFMVEEGSPVMLIGEGGDDVKEITWEEEFARHEQDFEHEIEIAIRNSPGSFTTERVELVATTATSKESSCISSIFYN